MCRDVVGMSMADEDFLRTELWLMRIHPQTQFRKMQAAVVKFESNDAGNLIAMKGQCKLRDFQQLTVFQCRMMGDNAGDCEVQSRCDIHQGFAVLLATNGRTASRWVKGRSRNRGARAFMFEHGLARIVVNPGMEGVKKVKTLKR